MVTGCKLALGLSHIEWATVGLGVTCDEEYEEGDDSRDVTLEHKPLPWACLCLNDTAHLHGSCQDYSCNQAEAERHLVRNHLHCTTHGRNHRVLIVRTPTCEEDTYHADRRNGGEQEYTYVEIEDGSTHVPRQERECTYTTDNHQKWSNGIEQLVGTVNEEYLLDEHLQHVGKHLKQSPVSYSHRAKTALEVGTNLTLHKYQYARYEGISQQDTCAH